MNAKNNAAEEARKAEHEATKAEILGWMRTNKMTRELLAKELGASKGTLDNWFSKGFPEWALKAIERLKNPTGDMTAGLEVTFTAGEFAEILEAMDIVGCNSLKTFYEEAIRNHVGEILKSEGAPQTKKATNISDFASGVQSQQKVAEEPGEYKAPKNGTDG